MGRSLERCFRAEGIEPGVFSYVNLPGPSAGVVMINDHLMGHGLAGVPWGGLGESGLGRAHGEIGFDEVTAPQCIVRDYLPLVKKDLWWHPYSQQVYDGMHGILDLLYARQAGRRLSGLGRLARLLPRTFEQ